MEIEEYFSKGTQARIHRIEELRSYPATVVDILEVAISHYWMFLENRAMGKQGNTPDNKAPNTGSNKSNDNKATADGKPVDPNRPKAE